MSANCQNKLGIPLIALCLFWLIGVVAGSAVLTNYVSIPGLQGKAVKKLPVGDSLALAAPLSTLIMVVHPQCPCTQASITELAIIMARCHHKVKGYVLFVSPSNLPINWTKSDLWYRIKGVPGVSPIIDVNGSMAHRLNAETSGQTFVYDAQGDLLFSGGITGGRGHEGDNAGVDLVVACINGRNGDNFAATNSPSTEVFGCALFSCSRVKPALQTSKADKP